MRPAIVWFRSRVCSNFSCHRDCCLCGGHSTLMDFKVCSQAFIARLRLGDRHTGDIYRLSEKFPSNCSACIVVAHITHTPRCSAAELLGTHPRAAPIPIPRAAGKIINWQPTPTQSQLHLHSLNDPPTDRTTGHKSLLRWPPVAFVFPISQMAFMHVRMAVG